MRGAHRKVAPLFVYAPFLYCILQCGIFQKKYK